MRTNLKIAVLSLISIFLIGCSNETDETVNNEEIAETEEINEGNDSLELKDKSTFITEGFAILLDYNNETYDDRSNDLQNYFTAEAIQQAIGYEHVDTEVSFESKNSNNEIFKSLGDETNKYILITDVVFEVEDVVTTDITNIYEFELIENEGQYRIDNLRSTPKQQNQQ